MFKIYCLKNDRFRIAMTFDRLKVKQCATEPFKIFSEYYKHYLLLTFNSKMYNIHKPCLVNVIPIVTELASARY